MTVVRLVTDDDDKKFCSWCGPCKALEPRLENVVAKRSGKVNVAKVNVDDLGELAAKYDVMF